MTVKDLKNILNKFEDDLVISVSGYEGGVTDNIEIVHRRVYLNVNNESYFGEHEVSSDGEEYRLLIARN